MRSLSRPTLTLEQNGLHVSLTDEQIALLGDVTVPRIEALASAAHGYDVQRHRHSLLRSLEGLRIPNAGCLPLLSYRAAKQGFHLRVQQTPAISKLPEPENREDLNHPHLPEFVRSVERGLIRIPATFNESIIVAELADAFPECNILVLGANLAALEHLQHGLHAARVETDGAEADHGPIPIVHDRQPLILTNNEEMPKLILSTFLGAGNLDFAISDLVIFLDAEQCVHERAQLILEQIDARFRLFGLTRAGRKKAPYEAGMVMAVFGPELIDLMADGGMRRDVHVAWVQNKQPKIHQERVNRDFDFRCCWHNERRNRTIATLAKTLASGTPFDPQKHRNVAAWFDGRPYRPQAVTILVDRLIHACALAKKLPEWPIIAGEDLDLFGLPVWVKTRLKRDRRGWRDGHQQIVLTDAAASFDGHHTDVVIWAGAGPYGAPIPKGWLGQRPGTELPLLVVDFLDLFNDQTREWQRKRQKDYEHHDIFEAGVDPVIGRIERFLGNHSRGQR